MMAVFDDHGDPVRPEILAAFERAWAQLAPPGTWWDGPSRVAIAAPGSSPPRR